MINVADPIEKILDKLGISDNSAKALQFMVGLGIIALSVTKFSSDTQILSVMGIIFGGYLILKAVQ